MKICNATEKHFPEFVAMWIDFMKYHEKMDPYFAINEDAAKNYGKYIHTSLSSENSLILVALDETDHVIGRAVCQVDVYPPIFMQEKYIHLWEMDVKEEFRGRGVGSALYQRVLEWCKDKHIKRIELEVQPKNSLGSRLWTEYEFKDFLHKMYIDL
jgi:GNAT superfamily N-acetyltransferase